MSKSRKSARIVKREAAARTSKIRQQSTKLFLAAMKEIEPYLAHPESLSGIEAVLIPPDSILNMKFSCALFGIRFQQSPSNPTSHAYSPAMRPEV